MSYTDLQSVTAAATGCLAKSLSGDCHSTLWSSNQAQNILNHDKRSTAFDKAMASALNVLRATLGIFLEDHAIGQTTVVLLLRMFVVVENVMAP